MDRATTDVYGMLGVRRVINACGHMTLLGGSRLSPRVLAAMAAANEAFVDMAELLERSGRAVAARLGAEAAAVTSGCFAGLVLGAAAIMTGTEPARIARLPATDGMRHEFLIQASTRYHYDRAVTVPGGRLVPVGDADGTTAAQLEAAIGPRTAGILYLAKAEGTPGVLPLADVVAIARRAGIAVLVDAAAEVYPLERMRWLAGGSGADLVCFGAKYFGSANSAGVVCGRRQAVDAVLLNNFVAYESADTQALGRGYKVDRHEVIATVVALEEWFALDHEARLAEEERRLRTIAAAVEGLAGVRAEIVREQTSPWKRLIVRLDVHRVGTTAAAVEAALRAGDPSIRVRVEGNDLVLAAHTLDDGDAEVVGRHLRHALA
jgi:L-seryl-tRNA(Ser) seleniumtransferase